MKGVNSMRLSSLYQLYRKRHYVYEHYIDGNLIYIGKGQGGRAVDFWGRNDKWIRIVDGRYEDVEVKIVKGFEDELEAFAFEYELIRLNSNNDNLTNYRSSDNYVQYRYKRQTKEFILNRIVEVVPEYLDRDLINADKTRLCEDLNLIDAKGRMIMWPTIRKYLIENRFVLDEKTKTINGKRCRIVIIHDTNEIIDKLTIKSKENDKMGKTISKVEQLLNEKETLKSQISDNEKRLGFLLDAISDLLEDTSNLERRKENLKESINKELENKKQ